MQDGNDKLAKMKNNDTLIQLADRRSFILLGWLLLMFAVAAISALSERQRLLSEFRAEAAILHRLASQRADQHDAHLTSLSALAVAGGDARRDLFLEVASTIRRFYPRIEAIDLIPLDPSAAYLSTRTGLSEDQLANVRRSARTSDGQIKLQAVPDAPSHYLLVKRSPNSGDARFALAMQQFEKPLGSSSQPLVLQAGISPALPDLLALDRLAIIAGIATFLYLPAVLGIRQFGRARRAERQAYLSGQEARLAHASRVNALGEMASGMAHELTQPLTAILSQAQAGRHLAAHSGATEVSPVLESIVAQAKRASAILDRLRNWTKPHSKPVVPTSVNDAVRNVELLLRSEAERAGIDLSTDLDAQTLDVQANQVELEQIIFNLVRNALDAVAGMAERHVAISTRHSGGEIVIEISDTGPGIPEDIRQRIFEPFVTGKPGGTGLGLALCQRLAERMEGTLTLVAEWPETVFRLQLPQAGSNLRKAAAE